MADPNAQNVANGNGIASPNSVEIWSENPVTEEFNPGTSTGQKIFLLLSKGPDDGKKFSLSPTEAQDFMSFIRSKAQAFGPCVTHVPSEWDNTGRPLRFVNIIDQYQSIGVDILQRAAFERYSTPVAPTDPIPPQPWNSRIIDPANNANDRSVFYSRVHSSVVAQTIFNSLDPRSLKTLELEKDKFTFYENSGIFKKDGPTQLYCLLKLMDPSTAVNIENHRRAIETTRMHHFGNKVTDMVTDISRHYKIIIDNKMEYNNDTYLRHLFEALESGPNAEFNAQIKSIRKDVDMGIGYHSKITPKELISAAITSYNNLVSKDEWGKVDPHQAQIMALTTELNKLREATAKTALTTAGSNPPGQFRNANGAWEVEKWRTEFKGPTIEQDGKTWHWCKHHKSPGCWDGLYVANHTEATHNKWKAAKDKKTAEFKARKAAKGNSGNSSGSGALASASSQGGGQKQMEVSSRLRTASATNLGVCEEDINKIINEYQGN
jgi:hypothetical protein